MEKYCLLLLISFSISSSNAQNVGIGTNTPDTRLHVIGDFSVTAASLTTSTAPTAAQTLTMLNAATVQISGSDSIGRIFDPGGQSGNYIGNLTANARIPRGVDNSYLEFTIETADIGAGDSLIIYAGNNPQNPVYFSAGNSYSASGITYTLPSQNAFVVFKSNADASVGAGFSLLFKRRYFQASQLPPINSQAGNLLAFYGAKGALRSGRLSASPIGDHSTAFGGDTEATGQFSTAMGYFTSATGNYSTSTGSSTVASGTNSFTTGESTWASGEAAAAMGFLSSAPGDYSTALGFNTKSKSFASLAIGMFNDTLPGERSDTWQSTDRAFVIGDGVFSNQLSSSFYILKNGNGWMQGTLTQNSDATLKTNIHRVDDALNKIKQLNGYTYNWKDSAMLPGVYTGVLAQEVQKVMPSLVVPNTEGQLAVNYNGLIPYLIESIKTLEMQNKVLQKKVKALEKSRRK